MTDIDQRIDILETDITKLDVDAIVNAANEQLAPGGGVCGAIHAAAGPELAHECKAKAPCPTGDAKTTGGHDLKARWVVHAVGPVWHGGGQGEEGLLRSAYVRSLEEAARVGARSIAFPAISTGIFGYPPDQAARVAVGAVAEFLREHDTPARVLFACFSPESAAHHRKALADR